MSFDAQEIKKKQETKDEDEKVEYLPAGYIQMSFCDSDAKPYWVAFDMKNLQILIYENRESIKNPIETIYLKTCKEIRFVDSNDNNNNSNSSSIIFEDMVTGIRYKFEQIPDNNGMNEKVGNKNNAWFNKVAKFMGECFTDFIFSDITARQQFNRFLKYNQMMARQKSKLFAQLSNAVKQSLEGDKALKEATTWLQRQKLDDEDREILKRSLLTRNRFWNLMIDTRKILNDDYISSLKVCSALDRWDNIMNKSTNLDERDKKILAWGLTEIEKLCDKQGDMESLKESWQVFGTQIAQMKVDLQKFRQKWEKKVEGAGKISKWCKRLGYFVIGAALIIAIVGKVVTLPVWVGLACFGGFGVGVAAIFIGDAYEECAQNIKIKADNIAKTTKSFEESIQDWIEAISLLEIPLVNIGYGGKCADEVSVWSDLNQGQLLYLQTAKDNFKIFNQRCKKALDDIRLIQQQVKL